MWLAAASLAACRKAHAAHKLGALPADHFCAGLGGNGGGDTCRGDSGGGLVVPGKALQVGLLCPAQPSPAQPHTRQRVAPPVCSSAPFRHLRVTPATRAPPRRPQLEARAIIR